MATRYLCADPLRVEPELLGQPLASPRRRMTAFAIDFMLLILPTVVVAVAWVAVTMWAQNPHRLAALVDLMRHEQMTPEHRKAVLREIAPLLVELKAEDRPAELDAAVQAGDLDRAAEILEPRDFLIALNLDEHPPARVGRDLIRVPLEKLIPKRLRGVAIYGVAALYFSLFAIGRRGATPGKRLLGLRVVRLDGHPLTLMEGLERFGGYLHIPGTLFVSLADLWRDPNRRLPHDRVVHTAVLRIDKRRPPARAAEAELPSSTTDQGAPPAPQAASSPPPIDSAATQLD